MLHINCDFYYTVPIGNLLWIYILQQASSQLTDVLWSTNRNAELDVLWIVLIAFSYHEIRSAFRNEIWKTFIWHFRVL